MEVMFGLSLKEQLKVYKESIMNELVKSENIVKAIVNTPENFLEIPVTINPTSLIYQNIFPYKKIPKIEDEVKIYITIKLGGFKPYQQNTYKIGYIVFYVFTHDDLMKTDEGTRVDYIIGEIDEIFNGKKHIFANSLVFDGMDEIEFPNNYYGAWIRYKGTDLK